MFTMAPRFCSIILRPKEVVQWNVPFRTMSTTALNPFGEMSSVGARKFPAALLTSASTRPISLATRSAASCTAFASRTSQEMARPEPSCAMTASSFSLRRPSTAMRAPSSENLRAISAPRPEPPPVTTMTRSFSKSRANTETSGLEEKASPASRVAQARRPEHTVEGRMMQIGARRVYLALLGAAALVAPAVRAQGGRLVVFVVVDQLRYQDLLWARAELGPNGFGGLGQPLQARYRTALTHTAPDHATLATGTYPDVHGIVGNTLVDEGKPVEAIDDPACENWRGTRRQGPGKLLVPTVADALKLATLGRARALAVSFKDRGALFLAGRAADLALFWDYDNGEMTSSRCYADEPPQWVAQLQRKNPASEWKDYVWTLSRREAVYERLAEPESTSSEPYGLGPAFPHRVGRGELGKPFFTALRASPPSTTIVLRAAEAGVAAMQLGDRGGGGPFLLSPRGPPHLRPPHRAAPPGRPAPPP